MAKGTYALVPGREGSSKGLHDLEEDVSDLPEKSSPASTLPHHSGRRRCVALLACLFLLFVLGIAIPVVGPMLSSVIQSNQGGGGTIIDLDEDETHAPSSSSNHAGGKDEDDDDGLSDEPHDTPTGNLVDEDEEPIVNGTLVEDQPDPGQQQPKGEGEEDDDPIEEEDDDEDFSGKSMFEFDEREDYKSLTAIYNRSITKRFVDRCSANWPLDTQRRFMAQCGYWSSKYAQWEEQVSERAKAVRYTCASSYMCHGWGDRVGGLQTAFVKALELKRRFEIKMADARKYFTQCAFARPGAKWDKQPSRAHGPQCSIDAGSHCREFIGNTCARGDLTAYQMYRTCVRSDHCSHVQQYRPQVYSAATIYGCGMRTMLEPSAELLNSPFPFRVGGESRTMTLKEIHAFMSKYYVISVHMRMGDATAFGTRDATMLSRRKEYFLRPLRCASTLETSMADSEGKINGKEVRYFVASDFFEYKKWIWQLFGDKAMGFAFTPQHIGLMPSQGKDHALMNEWGEWLTIGLGDQLVINKIGLDPSNVYSGRESGFSMTSWLYQIKHILYDANKCRRYSVPLHGIFSQSPPSCQSELIRAGQQISQPHLTTLFNQNLSFPNAYLDFATKKPVVVKQQQRRRRV